jgi:hypothetical protein
VVRVMVCVVFVIIKHVCGNACSIVWAKWIEGERGGGSHLAREECGAGLDVKARVHTVLLHVEEACLDTSETRVAVHERVALLPGLRESHCHRRIVRAGGVHVLAVLGGVVLC